MAMTPFLDLFPVTARQDSMGFTVTQEATDVPAGVYRCIEFYCTNPECDCRRVIVWVTRDSFPGRPLAAIGYGWENLEFYARFAKSGLDPVELKDPYLDPFNPQSSYSPGILARFRAMLENPAINSTLARHYGMVRGLVIAKSGGEGQLPNRGSTRKRDPSRRKR